MTMATSIQVSEELKKHLEKMKITNSETYEEIIWDLLEDRMELNEETLKDIELAMKEKKTFTLAEVKKELGF